MKPHWLEEAPIADRNPFQTQNCLLCEHPEPKYFELLDKLPEKTFHLTVAHALRNMEPEDAVRIERSLSDLGVFLHIVGVGTHWGAPENLAWGEKTQMKYIGAAMYANEGKLEWWRRVDVYVKRATRKQVKKAMETFSAMQFLNHSIDPFAEDLHWKEDRVSPFMATDLLQKFSEVGHSVAVFGSHLVTAFAPACLMNFRYVMATASDSDVLTETFMRVGYVLRNLVAFSAPHSNTEYRLVAEAQPSHLPPTGGDEA